MDMEDLNCDDETYQLSFNNLFTYLPEKEKLFTFYQNNI